MFVKSLTAKFKENEVPFGPKPQLAILKEVSMPNKFNKDTHELHKLEVIGGNYQRVAMQFMQTKDLDKYKYTEGILFKG